MASASKGSIDTVDLVETWWEVGQITPQYIWETKDDWYELAKKSREEWEKLSAEQKDASIRIIKACLERLYDTVDEWVPEAMKVQSGEFADIYFRVLFTDIDKDIQRNDAATSFKKKEAKKGTLAVLNKLASLADDDEDDAEAA
jgi:hypothetical protein